MYCGACHRDAALFRALATSGHECLAIPLYTPLRTDAPLAGPTSRVFMGGINLYLDQAMGVFRRLPAALRRQFDRPSLLRGVSRFVIRTAPAKLGRLTVNVLAGIEGPHAAEIQRLATFLRNDFRPDIINLSNSLLASLAAPLREAVGVPIVSTLQGEESFIDALPQPYREQSIGWLRHHTESIDRFICCARERVPAMAEWLNVPQDRFAVIPTGIDPQPFAAGVKPQRDVSPIVLGYLSSIRPEKGLDLLIEALRHLVHFHQRDVRLAIAGQVLDKSYWHQMRHSIRSAGLQNHVSFQGELDLQSKVRFLQTCRLFIMPTRLPESRAVAAMEALAAGVPVIASRLGVLPELLECTGGGITVPPDDSGALSAAILQLLDNVAQMNTFSERAPSGIARHYSPQTMAERTIADYQCVLATRGSPLQFQARDLGRDARCR